MPITTSSVFNRVRLFSNDVGPGNWIAYIQVYNNDSFVGSLEPINYDQAQGWDTQSGEFVIVRNKVRSGAARYQYVDADQVVHEAADLPGKLFWMPEHNPIKREIDLIQAVEDDEVYPSVRTVYKASVDAPTATPPRFGSVHNTWTKWKAALESAGYSVSIPDTTGEEVVWSNTAAFSRSEGVYECEWEGWQTQGVRYSVDNGQTWTLEPPTVLTSAGLSMITHIQRWSIPRSEWVIDPVHPKFQGETGVNTSVLESSAAQYSIPSNDNYVQASFYLPRKFNIRNIQRGKTTHIGLEVRLRDRWNGDVILEGYRELQYSAIPLVMPHEVSEGVIAKAGSTYLFRLDSGGELHAGLIRTDDRLDDYYGDYARFTAYFRTNPYIHLADAINTSQTTLRVKEIPAGLESGNVIYMRNGDDEEVVRVNADPDLVARTATEDEGGYTYYNLAVSRGLVNTLNPPHAFPANSVLSEGKRDKHIEYFAVTAKRNFHAASEIIFYRIFDQ